MIEYYSETDFRLEHESGVSSWIEKVLQREGKKLGDLSFIFCSDSYLHELNVSFLKHDTLTDVISFDNTLGNLIGGEIYISVDRVAENAETFGVTFMDELQRVMIHGVLHFCGYHDKTKAEVTIMRRKEDESLALRIDVSN